MIDKCFMIGLMLQLAKNFCIFVILVMISLLNIYPSAAKKKAVPKGRAAKKKEEKVSKGRVKLDPNRKLVPNTKIELVNKDPMFEVK